MGRRLLANIPSLKVSLQQVSGKWPATSGLQQSLPEEVFNMNLGGIAEEDCGDSSDCEAECWDEATSAIDGVLSDAIDGRVDYESDPTNSEQALPVIFDQHDFEVVIHLPARSPTSGHARSPSSQHALSPSDPISPSEEFPDLVHAQLSPDHMVAQPLTDPDCAPNNPDCTALLNPDCTAPPPDHLPLNPDHAPMIGANFDRDDTPLGGSTEDADDKTVTDEADDKTTADCQSSLVLSSLKPLRQSAILKIGNGDGGVSDHSMRTYLGMLAQAHRESTQVFTVAIQDPSFWVMSEEISVGNERYRGRLLDGQVVDMAVIRKVLIPRWNRDHWQLFVIDRDLRMINFYCPMSGTVHRDDREVSSKIDIKYYLLTSSCVDHRELCGAAFWVRPHHGTPLDVYELPMQPTGGTDILRYTCDGVCTSVAHKRILEGYRCG
jgi:hypothetical protein